MFNFEDSRLKRDSEGRSMSIVSIKWDGGGGIEKFELTVKCSLIRIVSPAFLFEGFFVPIFVIKNIQENIKLYINPCSKIFLF